MILIDVIGIDRFFPLTNAMKHPEPIWFHFSMVSFVKSCQLHAAFQGHVVYVDQASGVLRVLSDQGQNSRNS